MTKIYNYTPNDTLTVQELSTIMKVLFVSLIEGIQGQPVKGVDDLQIDEDIHKTLPPEILRHFTEE